MPWITTTLTIAQPRTRYDELAELAWRRSEPVIEPDDQPDLTLMTETSPERPCSVARDRILAAAATLNRPTPAAILGTLTSKRRAEGHRVLLRMVRRGELRIVDGVVLVVEP